eukprot:1973382-Rhodomonas_salina.3
MAYWYWAWRRGGVGNSVGCTWLLETEKSNVDAFQTAPHAISVWSRGPTHAISVRSRGPPSAISVRSRGCASGCHMVSQYRSSHLSTQHHALSQYNSLQTRLCQSCLLYTSPSPRDRG